MHALQDLPFTSVVSEHWASFPDAEELRRHIAVATLAHAELTDQALGLYAPPSEIRTVRLTHAAFDQIRTMWHGHRELGAKSPPTIPLKLFITAFGQDGKGKTWVDIEVHPGFSNWEVPD